MGDDNNDDIMNKYAIPETPRSEDPHYAVVNVVSEEKSIPFAQCGDDMETPRFSLASVLDELFTEGDRDLKAMSHQFVVDRMGSA